MMSICITFVSFPLIFWNNFLTIYHWTDMFVGLFSYLYAPEPKSPVRPCQRCHAVHFHLRRLQANVLYNYFHRTYKANLRRNTQSSADSCTFTSSSPVSKDAVPTKAASESSYTNAATQISVANSFSDPRHPTSGSCEGSFDDFISAASEQFRQRLSREARRHGSVPNARPRSQSLLGKFGNRFCFDVDVR